MRRSARSAAGSSTSNGSVALDSFQNAPVKEAVCIFVISVSLITMAPFVALSVPQPVRTDLEWWKTSVIYRLEVGGFHDSDGDGYGDIRGVISKLGYLRSLGVGVIWLDSVMYNPDLHENNGVLDFKQVHPLYGNMTGFKELMSAAHGQDLRVIIEFIPNHSSRDHPWFMASRQTIPSQYSDYYVWHDGRIDASGMRHPPNNWEFSKGKSMWTYDEVKGQYYLHQLGDKFPDLNWRNTKVQQEMKDAMVHWLGLGVDGFFLRSFSKLYESSEVQADEPGFYDLNNNAGFRVVRPSLTHHQPETFQIADHLSELLHAKNSDIFIMVDALDRGHRLDLWQQYYHHRVHMPFNHYLPVIMSPECDGWCLNDTISSVLEAVPEKKLTNWAIGDSFLPRAASSLGQEYVTVANMLNLLLPGVAVSFYGDELGQEGLCQDQEGVMLCGMFIDWESDTHTKAVKSQHSEPLSILNKYRELVKLRNRPVLQWGEHKPVVVNQHIYSFIRFAAGRFYPRYLISINIGTKTSSDSYVMKVGKVNIPQNASVIFSTHHTDYLSHNTLMDLTHVSLKPGQGFVVEFPSNTI